MTELASFSARPVLLPICFAFFFLFHKAAIISKLHMGTVNPGMKRIGIIAIVFNNYNYNNITLTFLELGTKLIGGKKSR